MTISKKVRVLEFLEEEGRHYVLHAPDPLIRDAGPTARSKCKKQLGYIMDKFITMDEGREMQLSTWNDDNLARIMVSHSFFCFLIVKVHTLLGLQRHVIKSWYRDAPLH